MDGFRRQKPHNSLRGGLALISITALLLGACSATQSPGSSPVAPGSSPVAPGSSAAPSGTSTMPTNHFTLAIESDPQDLDPAVETDLPGAVVTVNVYEPLVSYAGSPPQPVPYIAESITGSPDSKVFTVKLKPGLKFHDGSPLDAAAVVFSMDRVLTMAQGRAQDFKGFLEPGDTKALDNLTVQFNLRAPSAYFPATLAFFYIVNPNVIKAHELPSGPYGANGDFAQQYLQTHDAGSGPYEIVSRTPNSDIELAAFPDYWQGWKANQFNQLTVKVVNDPTTAGLLMTQGQADEIYETYPTSVFDQLSSAPNVTVHTDLSLNPFYIFMNNQKAPLDNVKVRQAIAYAFDYKQALLIAPGSQLLPGPLPAGMFAALSTPTYQMDLVKAKSLLAEAGIQPGTVTLSYGSLGGPASVQTKIGLLLQANLAQVGITVNITQNAWADILAQTTKPATTQDFYAIQLAADYIDPDAFLSQAWTSASHGSWSGAQWYTNSQVDALIQQGKTTLDPNKRLTIYQQIQQTIVTDSPAVFMMNLPIQVALNKSIGGYHFEVEYYNYTVYNLFKQ